MARSMSLPKIGVNMTEAVITKWLVKPGDKVSEGDAVLEAETDKSTQEIYSTESGVVAELLFKEGETVRCHEDFVVFAEEGEKYEKAKPAAPARPVQAAVGSKPVPPQPVTKHVARDGKPRVRISPLAKKIASEHNIDTGLLSPAEPGARIVKADVLRYIEENKKPATAETQDIFEAVPMTPIRKAIASRLSESNLQKPCAALTTTVDAKAILLLRERYRQRGIKLSVDVVLAKVAGRVLTLHRGINSVLEGDAIHILREINVGVAVDTPKGLMVPVLRNADTTPLAELSDCLTQMALEAKESRLAACHMSGGTFTITNLGAFGVEQFTPVINPPECCILAVGAIKNEFVPDENEQPVLKKRFQVTLVFDHRIVDGAPAARFLKDFKEFAENPELLI